jgi:hypothetical protein
MRNVRKQGATTYPILFFLVSSTDKVTGLTAATPTVTLSKNGASFAAAATSPAEVGNGWYSLAGANLATDLNTLGDLVLHATASGADPVDEKYAVVPFDPFDAVRLGLSAMPNASAGASGGLPTGDASGRVTLAAATHTGAVIPRVTLTDATTAVATGLPSPAPLGYGPIGTGSVAVDEDYPTAGNLSYLDANGNGIQGAASGPTSPPSGTRTPTRHDPRAGRDAGHGGVVQRHGPRPWVIQNHVRRAGLPNQRRRPHRELTDPWPSPQRP